MRQHLKKGRESPFKWKGYPNGLECDITPLQILLGLLYHAAFIDKQTAVNPLTEIWQQNCKMHNPHVRLCGLFLFTSKYPHKGSYVFIIAVLCTSLKSLLWPQAKNLPHSEYWNGAGRWVGQQTVVYWSQPCRDHSNLWAKTSFITIQQVQHGVD